MNNPTIKVLNIIDTLQPGGAELMAVNLSNALSEKEGVKSWLIASRKEGRLKERINPDVNYCFLRKKRTFDLRALLKLYFYVQRHKIDIIHAHGSSFIFPALIEPFCRFKLLWHDHYGLPIQKDGKRSYPYKSLSAFFDFVICVSKPLVENNRKWLKINKHKIIFVPNFSKALPVRDDEIVQAGKGIRKIVMQANIRPQKDHKNLMNAILLVTKIFPKVKVYCVGGASDSAYLDELKEHRDKLGLQEVIEFVGEVVNPFVYTKDADVAVLSSLSEGMPLTLLEYGLACIPVVCTDVGQCNEIITGETGWIVPPRNAEALANGILEVLTQTELANNRAQQLNKLVNENYAESAITNKILGIYAQMLG